MTAPRGGNDNKRAGRSGAAPDTMRTFPRFSRREVMTTAIMIRGKAVSIKGLPKSVQTKFRRAVAFSGAPSVSCWLSNKIRRLIREQEQIHGDLMNALTPDEIDIVEVIQSGANDPEHIGAETMLAQGRLEFILSDLVDR